MPLGYLSPAALHDAYAYNYVNKNLTCPNPNSNKTLYFNSTEINSMLQILLNDTKVKQAIDHQPYEAGGGDVCYGLPNGSSVPLLEVTINNRIGIDATADLSSKNITSLKIYPFYSTYYPPAPENFRLNTTNGSFVINYNLSGNMESIAIVPNSNSLNFTLYSISNQTMSIYLPKKLIIAENTNGTEVNYTGSVNGNAIVFQDEPSASNDTRVIKLNVDAGVNQVIVSGSHVVPEFPPFFGILVMTTALAGVTMARFAIKSRLQKPF